MASRALPLSSFVALISLILLTGAASADGTIPGAGDPRWFRLLGSENREVAGGAAGTKEIFAVGGSERPIAKGVRSTTYDIVVAKYRPSGARSWQRFYGSKDGDEIATGVAVGKLGTAVVGYTDSPTFDGRATRGSDDAFVMAIDASGKTLWSRLISSDKRDRAVAVAVDGNGIYIVGNTLGVVAGGKSLGTPDAFLAKFSWRGALRWVRQIGGKYKDNATGLAVGDGRIYVVGDAVSQQMGGVCGTGAQSSMFLGYNQRGRMVMCAGWVPLRSGAVGWSPSEKMLYLAGRWVSDDATGVVKFDIARNKMIWAESANLGTPRGINFVEMASKYGPKTVVLVAGSFCCGAIDSEQSFGGDDFFVVGYFADRQGPSNVVKGVYGAESGEIAAPSPAGYYFGTTTSEWGGKNQGDQDLVLARYNVPASIPDDWPGWPNPRH